MADLNTQIELMLFEAGGLAASLPAHQYGAALAANVIQGALDAGNDGQTHFTASLSPTDVGMALSAASGSQSPLAQTVADKLKTALSAKLQELGIQYPEQSSTADAAPAPSEGDQPADNGAEAANSSDSSQSDDDQAASDGSNGSETSEDDASSNGSVL